MDRRCRGRLLRPSWRRRKNASAGRRGAGMTALRRLNAKGIKAFADHLRSIRAGMEFQANPALLYVDEFSSAVVPRIEIAARRFANKLDAAVYLANVLQPIETPALTADAGLWSWLALFY